MADKPEIRIRGVEYRMNARLSTGKVYRESTTACVITPLGDQWVTVPGYKAEAEHYPELCAAGMDQAWGRFCNV
jgi:hypothetical protein